MDDNSGDDSEPMTIDDYFSDLIDALDTNLPEGNVGQNSGFYLHSHYVGRDNKRRIVLFITHGKPAVARSITRVTYILPVPAAGARLFNLEGQQPATAATFDDMAVPAGQDAAAAIAGYAAANNIALWHAEVARVHALELAAAPSTMRTKLHNLGIYWRGMQRLLFDAVANTDIRMTRSFSDKAIPSSNRSVRLHHTSNAPRHSTSSVRPSSGSRRVTGRRSTSRRSTSRRSTSHRSTSHRSTRSQSNSDPRKPQKKKNSDPT